jgi:hypothetical protein
VEDRDQFEFKLDAPAPGQRTSEADVVEEMDSFAMFAATVGQG